MLVYISCRHFLGYVQRAFTAVNKAQLAAQWDPLAGSNCISDRGLRSKAQLAALRRSQASPGLQGWPALRRYAKYSSSVASAIFVTEKSSPWG